MTVEAPLERCRRVDRPHEIVRMTLSILVMLALLGAAARATAAPGDLDPSFGTGGEAGTALVGAVDGLALDSQGRILVSGFVDLVPGPGFAPAIARYRSDGSPDTTFGESGVARLDARLAVGPVALGVGPDDRPLVAGLNDANGPPPQAITVVRLRLDGTIDPSFGDAGSATLAVSTDTNPVPRVLVHADGGFDVTTLVRNGAESGLLLGYFDDAGHQHGGFTTPGGLDLVDQADVALQPDGRFVLAGRRNENDTTFSLVIARYERSGALDRTFGKRGRLRTDVALSRDHGTSVALAPDGAIVTAGSDGSTATVARFSPNGRPDPGFGVNGRTRLAVEGARETVASAVAIGADARVVLAGSAGAPFAGDDWLVAGFEADGALARDFGDAGLFVRTPGAMDDVASQVVIQPDGRIVVAGIVGRIVVVDRYLGFPRSCGDADGNAAITVTDGVQALRAAVALPSSCLADVCDVDGSGDVTVTDGVRILRAAAELPIELDCSR